MYNKTSPMTITFKGDFKLLTIQNCLNKSRVKFCRRVRDTRDNCQEVHNVRQLEMPLTFLPSRITGKLKFEYILTEIHPQL